MNNCISRTTGYVHGLVSVYERPIIAGGRVLMAYSINGDVKYQPKHVSSYGMINWKRGRPVWITLVALVLRPELPRGEFKAIS